MKITIDVRGISDKCRGIGIFERNMIREISKLDKVNDYVLFVSRDSACTGLDLGDNFSLVELTLPMGIADIIEIPMRINILKPDIAWFPANGCVPFIHSEIEVLSTIHDVMFISQKYRFLSRHWLGAAYRRVISRIAVKRSDRINTVSAYSKQQISDKLRVKGDNIFVTYNGRVESGEAPSKAIKKELFAGAKYIYTISGETPNKNLPGLIRGFNVFNKDKDMKLVVTGVKDTPGFTKKNKELNLERVVFTGYLSEAEKSTFIAGCEAFAFVSIEEGFGLPPMEALSAGKKVLFSDIPVLRELYDGCGIFVDPEDAGSMAEGLKRTVESGGPDAKTVENVLKKFFWEDSALRMIEVFNEIGKGE